MEGLEKVQMEATLLRGKKYAVRPAGQLGTCGFYPVPWTVEYVNARSEREALWKASPLYHTVSEPRM